MRVAHRLEHAGADGFQALGIAALGVEHVLPVLVDDAGMDMQAGAGVLGIGLGHAGGFQPVMAGRLFGKTLEVDAIVGGSQRIRAVQQVDLELAGAEFRRGGVGRQALSLGPAAQRLQIAFERIDGGHVVELIAVRLAAIGKALRRTRAAGLAPVVFDHVEFQLGGDDRRQAARVVFLQHRGEDGARVHEAGRAV